MEVALDAETFVRESAITCGDPLHLLDSEAVGLVLPVLAPTPSPLTFLLSKHFNSGQGVCAAWRPGGLLRIGLGVGQHRACVTCGAGRGWRFEGLRFLP